jgi:hypothetical protein
MSDRALQLISNLLKNPDGCVTESNSLVGMADCIVYDAHMCHDPLPVIGTKRTGSVVIVSMPVGTRRRIRSS